MVEAQPPSLAEQALAFAQELAGVLSSVLPNAPDVVAEIAGERVVIRPTTTVPISVKAERLASLEIHMRCVLDHRGEWLAVESSAFKLSLDTDRTPLFRFEFIREMNRTPCAHLQVHAQRGALSHLLSKAGHKAPHEMAELHLPLGGARYRPCVEDVLQFLVDECGADARDGWRDAVNEGRARWRRKQAKAVARDFPEETAETLRRMGYRIESPDEVQPSAARPLYAW